MSLKDKVAVVTGASRGIGRAIALRLARDGALVCVNYHSNAGAAKALLARPSADVINNLTFQGGVSWLF